MFYTILILRCKSTGELDERLVCGGYISQVTYQEREMFPNHTIVAAIRSDVRGVAEHIKDNLENID